MRGLLSGAVVAAAIAACETRSVYLVPFGDALHADAGHHGGAGGSGPKDSGAPAHDASPILRPDGGRPTCETNRYPEEAQPLGVYIMVDQSSTMGPVWGAVSDALSQFIQQSATLGKVSVGIKYYALAPNELEPGQAYQSVVCLAETYKKPAVPIEPLPNNATPLLDSITNHTPSALTTLLANLFLFVDIVPTDAALGGAIAGAREWAASNSASHAKAVVLLVTNGVPTTSALCVPSVDAAKLAATDGVLQSPSVGTYVLDVGASNADLDAIAKEGGTDHAYPAASSADMLTALQSIRELALPCEIDVAKYAHTLDRLNVELSTDGGSTRFSRLSSQAACAPGRNDEWYLELSDTSTKVRLCPNTCVHARSVDGATLDVVLGCRTTVD